MSGWARHDPFPPNPFVGPRPFERGERLYGRDQEVRDLDNLLAAERIVLLHSPSGAGKSSLVQAALLPRLVTSYDIWGPTRVNQEPADLSVNRYLLSALQGLENGVHGKLRRPAEVLAGQTLHEYVEKRPHRRWAPRNVLLVFDQFEEVLTVDPLAESARQEFFDQLGEALRNPRVWALFVLREDYLAPLDPYARRVPSFLRNRFRIDLLGLDAAREAIVNPAQIVGRDFPAAGELVRDLATMKVQQADGSFVEQTGRHVEPVHLQVVCFRLWDALPGHKSSIEAEDLERFGDVTEALGAYYADSVATVADGDEARERAVRDWFSEALITAGGLRGQVLKGHAGMDDDTIRRLLDTHLVRAEQRAGATWYELAHDRLIEPVRSRNVAWRAEHLSEAQQRAALWERQGRPQGLLLAGRELAAGERWAADAAVVTDVERRFLDQSRQAEDAAERERRQTRLVRRLGVAAMAIGVLALLFGLDANRQRRIAEAKSEEAERQRRRAEVESKEAERQRRIAEAESEEAERQRQLAERQAEVAEQRRREAERQKQAADRARDEADVQRRTAKEQTVIAEANEARALEQEQAAVRARDQARTAQQQAERQSRRADENAAESERLRRIAEADALAVLTTRFTEPELAETAALLAVQAYRLRRAASGDTETSTIYNALNLALSRHGNNAVGVLHVHPAAVRSLAVAPDGVSLATGDDEGVVRVFKLAGTPRQPIVPGRAGSDEHGAEEHGIRDLDWSDDGRFLAAGGVGVRVWDATDLTVPALQLEGTKPSSGVPAPLIHAVVFGPGRELAVGDAEGGVYLWNLETASSATVPAHFASPADQGALIRDLAWRHSRLAAASDGQGVIVWDLDEPGAEPLLLAHETDVRAVAWSGEGHLAAGTGQGTIVVWRLEEPSSEPVRLPGHTARIVSLAGHGPRRLLASASFDGSLRLWDLRRESPTSLVLGRHDDWAWAVAFTPGGESLISGSSDRTIRLWATRSETLAVEICRSVTRNLSRLEWQEYLPAGVEYEQTCSNLA